KPFEELYDTEKDPHELKNLAGSKGHQATLQRLRKLHLAWLKETRDLSLLPEPEARARSKDSTPYEIGKNPNKCPQAKLLAAAEAGQADGEGVPRLLKLRGGDDAGGRWWAAVGLGVRGGKSEAAAGALRKALKDPSGVVRVAAADGLRRLGHGKEGLAALT